jgi:predicted MFS family arabinose efflux permease
VSKKAIILVLGLAGFTVMADAWVVSPLLPAISKDLSVNATSAGIIITAYMIPFGIFQLVFGPLADRFGKKQVITFAMIFFTISTGLCVVGNSLGTLTLYRVLAGIFAASVMPISMALISDIFPLEERQAAIGSFIGISFLGQGLCMAIGATLAYFFNWRGAFFLYAVLSLLSTMLLLTTGRGIPSFKNSKSEFLAPYLRLLSKKESLFIYLIIFFEGIMVLGSFSYIGSFVSSVYQFNSLYIGLIMTGFGMMSVIGGRLSGGIANRIGKKKILVAGLCIAALSIFILFISGNILSALVAGVALFGFGFILAHSTLITIASEFAPRSRAIAMSLVTTCFVSGGGIGTAIGGSLIKVYGFNAFFLYYGIALIILVVATTVLVKNQDKFAKAGQNREVYFKN